MNFIINNTKLANCIRKYRDLPEHILVIEVSKAKAARRIETKFVLTSDLTYYDMAVADAIWSIQQEGAKSFTARKVMTVLSADPDISFRKERKEKLERSIDKLIHTEIYISCGPEAKNSSALLPFYSGAFLNAVKNGKNYEFQSLEPMPLYTYGTAKRQMITIPLSLFACTSEDDEPQTEDQQKKGKKKSLTHSDENLLLTYYLLHELEIVRNANNAVEKKAFQFQGAAVLPILEALDINIAPEDRSAKKLKENYGDKIKKIYERTKLLMDYWCRIGYLKEYKEDAETMSFYVEQPMFCHNPNNLRFRSTSTQSL